MPPQVVKNRHATIHTVRAKVWHRHAHGSLVYLLHLRPHPWTSISIIIEASCFVCRAIVWSTPKCTSINQRCSEHDAMSSDRIDSPRPVVWHMDPRDVGDVVFQPARRYVVHYSPVHSTSTPAASVAPVSKRYAHLHRLWLGARLQLHAIGSEAGRAGLSSKVLTSAVRLSICCVRLATSSRVSASSSLVVASWAL